VVLKELSA